MNAHDHCDDYIDDLAQPECLRTYLSYERLPAICKCGLDASRMPEELRKHAWTAPKPILYADYDGTLREGTPPKLHRIRVVMASRFGDVGITDVLHSEHGYIRRVAVKELTNFSTRRKRERT